MNAKVLALLLLAISAGPVARAEPQSAAMRFHIQAQALSSALGEFARQSDRQILFSTDIVGGKRIHEVKGELEPTAALTLLLQGTGLTFSVMPDDTILVRATNSGQAHNIAYTPSYLRLAQADVSDVQAAAQSQSTEPLPKDSGSSAAKEEVVVKAFRARTATKTDVLLTETPQAISIITSDEIASRGALGLQEALRYTAGVRTEINGSDLRFDYFSSRGFGATDYLDGMVRPDSYNTARTDVYTLERVEVLRGPSSVLYGQGTAGGIVNSMTKRPKDQFAAELALEYGSYDRKQAQVDITGPLSDTVSARLVGVFRDAENQFDFGRDDRVVVSPSLSFRPSDQTEITLLGLYQEDKAASVFPYLPVVSTLEAPAGRRLPDDTFLGEPSFNVFDRKQSEGSALLTHRFSDNLVFDGGLRYSRASGFDGGLYGEIWNGTENPFIDADSRVLPRYRYDWKVRTAVLTSDNRLQWKLRSGNFEHNLLSGIDYAHIDYETASAYAADAAPLNIYAPQYGAGVIDAELSPMSEQIAKQVGFYLQDHIRMGERATFVLGVRRDRVTTSLDDAPEQVDNATTFRVGVTYEVVEGVTPYASYAESFIPTIGVDVFGNEFKPQEGTQYEVGVKWQPDRYTLLSVAGFDLTGSNRPQTDPEDGNNTIQTGEVDSRGFEFEAIRRLPDNYSVSISYTYTDMEVSESSEPLEIGFPLSGVPQNQASLWGEKSFLLQGDFSARVGLGVRQMGSTQEAAIFSDGLVYTLESPSFTLADALVGFSWKGSDIALNATNLFDERYYGSCSIRTACSIGYRRNVVLRWTYRF